jgi:hypothetical protein
LSPEKGINCCSIFGKIPVIIVPGDPHPKKCTYKH